MKVDTVAHISMVSQSFIDSLGHAFTMSSESIIIKNVSYDSHMQCRLIKGLPMTTYTTKSISHWCGCGTNKILFYSIFY